MKKLMLAFAACAASTVGYCADIAWVAQEFTGKTSDIIVEGETVLAFAPVSFTIDGVKFINYNTDERFKFNPQNSCVLNVRKNGRSDSPITVIADVFNNNGPKATGAYETMLKNAWYENSSASSYVYNFQLRNLTVGDKYIVQYFVHDSRNGCNSRAAWAIGAEDAKLAEMRYGNSGDGRWAYGGALVGTFVADAETQSFSIGSTAAQINALQIRHVGGDFVIPKLAEGWYARPISGLGKDVINDGRMVFAYTYKNAVDATTMVNDVAFTAEMTSGSTSWGNDAVTVSPAYGNAHDQYGGYGKSAWTDYPANVNMGGNALGALLNTGVYHGSNASRTFTLNNLIAGKHYVVQLFFMAMNGSGSTSRSASVNGKTVRYGDNKDGCWTQGGSIIGIFTPDSDSYSFTVDYSNDAPQLNGIQLREFDRQWTYDSSAKTLSFNNTIIANVSANSKSLTIGDNKQNANAIDLDFSYPIAGDYKVVTINGQAFSGNAAVRRFVAPSSLRTINWEAFGNCPSLEFVELNEGLTSVQQLLFQKGTSLSRVVNPLPSTLSNQSYGLYSGCTSLRGDFIIEAGGMCKYPFKGTAVTSLEFKNVTGVDGYAGFSEMPNLTNVVLSTSLATVGTAGRIFGDIKDPEKFNLYWRSCPTAIAKDLFNGDPANVVTNFIPWHLRKQWISYMKSTPDHYFWIDGVRVDAEFDASTVTFDSVGQWGFGTADYQTRQVIRFWKDPEADRPGLLLILR